MITPPELNAAPPSAFVALASTLLTLLGGALLRRWRGKSCSCGSTGGR
ncbi:MAG: hypothetical protein K6U89_13710 [Chloroflexi bacterium]|nr:hypothetical protein [Chloroflexota bacterium]GIW09352.1 MAG: hypothetical protein KatS3mg061_0409 [Dehalococcoidia bacterium]